MPRRNTPLLNGHIYHVFNKSIEPSIPFIFRDEYQRFVQAVDYFRHASWPVKLSDYLKLDPKARQIINEKLSTADTSVSVLAYCIMPNHYHLLLCQNQQDGISWFMGNLQNSYTRYFNEKRQRLGPVFLPRFKAVEIESDEQLWHYPGIST
jgi:putative transposase